MSLRGGTILPAESTVCEYKSGELVQICVKPPNFAAFAQFNGLYGVICDYNKDSGGEKYYKTHLQNGEKVWFWWSDLKKATA